MKFSPPLRSLRLPEKILIAGIIIGLFLLLICQILHIDEPMGFYMNAAERLEGQAINFYDEFP